MNPPDLLDAMLKQLVGEKEITVTIKVDRGNWGISALDNEFYISPETLWEGMSWIITAMRKKQDK